MKPYSDPFLAEANGEMVQTLVAVGLFTLISGQGVHWQKKKPQE